LHNTPGVTLLLDSVRVPLSRAPCQHGGKCALTLTHCGGCGTQKNTGSQADAPAPRSAACLDRQHRKRCSAPCARSAYRRVTERASVKGWYQHADWGAGRAAWRQVLGRAGTRQVGANVVDDDQRAGQQEPDDAVEDVGHEERGRHKYEEQDQVRPRVLPELVQVAALLQAQHERHEACRGRPAPRASSCPPSARRPRLGSSMIWGACQSHMLGLRTRRNARTKQ